MVTTRLALDGVDEIPEVQSGGVHEHSSSYPHTVRVTHPHGLGVLMEIHTQRMYRDVQKGRHKIY